MECDYCGGRGYEFVTPAPMLLHGSGDPVTPDGTAFVTNCGSCLVYRDELEAGRAALEDMGLDARDPDNWYGVLIRAPGFAGGNPPEEEEGDDEG